MEQKLLFIIETLLEDSSKKGLAASIAEDNRTENFFLGVNHALVIIKTTINSFKNKQHSEIETGALPSVHAADSVQYLTKEGE